MMMAAWAMWKTPGRSTASSKARWAAVHRFAGRPRRRHRPPAGLVDLDRGVGEAVVWPPAVAAARVLRRGKSIDRAIAKSIDMAACGSVDKSTNELSVRDHADDDSDWASEGATPWGFRTGSPRERSEGLNRGSLPHSPALEELGSSRAAQDTKCRTGRHLRAPESAKRVPANLPAKWPGGWSVTGRATGRSIPSWRGGETGHRDLRRAATSPADALVTIDWTRVQWGRTGPQVRLDRRGPAAGAAAARRPVPHAIGRTTSRRRGRGIGPCPGAVARGLGW